MSDFNRGFYWAVAITNVVCAILFFASQSGGHAVNMDMTEIVVVLDRSGSMSSVASDVVGGLDEFVAKQKEAEGTATMTLVQFDTEYETVYSGKSLAEVPKAKLEPRGMTALLDAMGRTIHETEERLKKVPEAYRPGRVIFVTVTDGFENSSREFTKSQVNELIDRHHDWQFVYIGANQDAIKEGALFGINSGGTLTYTNTSGSINEMFNNLSTSTTNLRAGESSTTDVFFTDEQREAQDAANEETSSGAN